MLKKLERRSESKFIEWSSETTRDSYDILYISDIIKQLNRYILNGMDVGGGIGVFSSCLCNVIENCKVTVIDNGTLITDSFVSDKNIRLVSEDFIDFTSEQKFDFILLKLVLHHMIDRNERDTHLKQISVLNKAREFLNNGGIIIVEENLYEGVIGYDLPGKFIYQLTKLKPIEAITRKFGANTAGEGVRFRSLNAWKQLFSESDLRVDSFHKEPSWHWGGKFPIWKRIPLLVAERYQAIFVLTSNKQ